jgi:dTMP kinase
MVGNPLAQPSATNKASAHWRAADQGATAMRGRFIAIEGIDGSGKTTQAELLKAWLPGSGLIPEGRELIVTREPGGTPFGRELRELLLRPELGLEPCLTSELLLYAADRAQHVATVIWPALHAGHWVLCDRFTGSTVAYQGFGRLLQIDYINQLNKIASCGLEPDLVLWLDISVEEASQRRLKRSTGPADQIETTQDNFMSRARLGLATLFHNNAHWKRVNAERDADDIAATCLRYIAHSFA